jgi:4-alpha-glucanotransferase
MSSKANLAVIPMQDYLELTNEEGRMNTPAVAEGNWNWRISKRYRTPSLTKKIKDMTERNKRAVK